MHPERASGEQLTFSGTAGAHFRGLSRGGGSDHPGRGATSGTVPCDCGTRAPQREQFGASLPVGLSWERVNSVLGLPEPCTLQRRLSPWEEKVVSFPSVSTQTHTPAPRLRTCPPSRSPPPSPRGRGETRNLKGCANLVQLWQLPPASQCFPPCPGLGDLHTRSPHLDLKVQPFPPCCKRTRSASRPPTLLLTPSSAYS